VPSLPCSAVPFPNSSVRLYHEQVVAFEKAPPEPYSKVQHLQIRRNLQMLAFAGYDRYFGWVMIRSTTPETPTHTSYSYFAPTMSIDQCGM